MIVPTRVHAWVRRGVLPVVIAVAATPGVRAQSAPLPLSGRSAEGGVVTTTQTGTPGIGASVTSISSSIHVQGPLVGSVGGTGAAPFTGVLSLREAIRQGLEYNLSGVGLTNATRLARAQETVARSALLPNAFGSVSGVVRKVNLAALGVRFDQDIPGLVVPETVGPFNVIDLRAHLSQTLFDMTALNNFRAARETARGRELSAQDARDLIVLAVGGAYLQAIAARARVESARAQEETAATLFERAAEHREAGLASPLDVNRARVQVLSEQQRVTAFEADFAKQKINLARMTGLPPSDGYDLDADVPFSPAPTLSLADALSQASEHRDDLKAAAAQLRAAERALAAAQAVRLPSVAAQADFGTNRSSPTPAHSTYAVSVSVRVPIWEGGRAQGEIQQAQAVIAQRRAELDDLRAQVEGEVRKAYLDLAAAASQVKVAEAHVGVITENLALARQQFDAGIADNLTVVQSQELLAAAELDRINSVFAHNLGKLALARAIGRASEAFDEFLRLP